jgi:peptide/nickel transport system substrate-binding protein
VVRWRADDARHYRLWLQPGLAPFSNGRPVTLNDVAASLRLARDDPASPHASALRHIRRIVRRGDRLLLTLSRPDPRLPERLHLGVAPAGALHRGDLARHPLGSGTFELLAWQDDGGVLLRRRGDGLRVRFAVVPDPTMRALKLLHGEANLVQNDLPYEMYPLLARNPKIQLYSAPGTTFSYLGFNLADPVTSRRAVREAVAHAIDRAAIVRHLFNGHAHLTNTLLGDGHWAVNPDLPTYVHDPARARTLLAGLGYTPDHPLRISYKTSTDPFRLRVAAVLQAQLKQVGIDLRIHSNEWGTFFGDIKAGRFQMYSLSWVGIRSPDIFRHVFHSDALPPGGANRGRYRSPRVDRLIEQAEQAPRAQARALYRQIQARVHHDLVYVPLWHEDVLLLTRGVRGARPRPDGGYGFLEQVSLAHE